MRRRRQTTNPNKLPTASHVRAASLTITSSAMLERRPRLRRYRSASPVPRHAFVPRALCAQYGTGAMHHLLARLNGCLRWSIAERTRAAFHEQKRNAWGHASGRYHRASLYPSG